jgi:hypothetical protein
VEVLKGVDEKMDLGDNIILNESSPPFSVPSE